MRVVKGLLDRCFELIELLAENGEAMRLSQIAARLELPKGATHRLLAQLEVLGWVEQDATGLYRLTLKLALVGQRLLHATALPDLTQPILDALAAATRELVRLTVVQTERLFWIGSAQGAPPGLIYNPSMRGPVRLHATANGKAWLATLPNERAARLVLRDGFESPGPRALGTIEALLAELERTRARGHGLADEEAEAGVVAVAVAIHGRGDAVLGTVSVAGPKLRVTPARVGDLAARLHAAARDLAAAWPVGAAARIAAAPP